MTVKVTVKEKQDADKLVVFDCVCTNQTGQDVVTGVAEVIAPTEKIAGPKAQLPEIGFRRRDRYDEARARFPDAYDVLLWNRLGELSESTVANVVVELEGELLTPAEDAGLLPGTLRAELLDEGTIREATIHLEDLRRADRVWLINSVRGWVEVDVDFTTVPGRLAAASAYRR